jgi:lantibiotic modifying enzyme
MPDLSRRDLFRLGLTAGATLPWGISSAAGQEAPKPSVPAAGHLDAAVRAGRFLRSARVETPRGLLWLQGPERPEGLSTSTDLYSGTPGVVLFLLELARVTGDKTWREEAAAGADYLIASLQAGEDTGLYTGIAGIGFVLSRVYRETGNPAYRAGAGRCRDLIHAAAKPAGAGVAWGEGTDIIAGAAGTGLALLAASRETHDPASRELAAKAGLRLIELGIPEAGGLKWRFRMPPGSETERLMPNFSHGTAGIAYFLATLARETGRKEFLDAALAGARYLQAVANTAGDGCVIFHHEPEPDGKDLYYLGWCHGPAGTSRLFTQLREATGDERWLGWVKKGARSLLASGIPERETPGFWNNAGQCCGAAGVADFFLDLHRRTGEEPYLAFARRVTRNLLARATPTPGDGLKWIHAEHRARPDYAYAQTGYMQGAAGIGLLLLRMDAVDKGRDWTLRLPDSPA